MLTRAYVRLLLACAYRRDGCYDVEYNMSSMPESLLNMMPSTDDEISARRPISCASAALDRFSTIIIDTRSYATSYHAILHAEDDDGMGYKYKRYLT